MLSLDSFWIVVMVLAAAASGYAYLLSRPAIQRRYVPDWTIATVIGGFLLVDLAMAALAARGLFSWDSVVALVILEIAAGIPVAVWQGKQYLDRREERERAKRNGGAHAE